MEPIQILELTFSPNVVSKSFVLQSLSCVSLWPHGLQHTSLPCPSLSPRVCSYWCPLSQWCHPTISPFAALFFFCFQSFPGSGSFLVSQLFASGGQSIGTSTSAPVLPMNIQGLFPLGLTGLISLLSKGLSSVFSRTTVWKHQDWIWVTTIYRVWNKWNEPVKREKRLSEK